MKYLKENSGRSHIWLVLHSNCILLHCRIHLLIWPFHRLSSTFLPLFCFVFFLFFLFLFYLVRWPTSYIQAQYKTASLAEEEIFHIASIVVHTTLNTYEVMKICIESYENLHWEVTSTLISKLFYIVSVSYTCLNEFKHNNKCHIFMYNLILLYRILNFEHNFYLLTLLHLWGEVTIYTAAPLINKNSDRVCIFLLKCIMLSGNLKNMWKILLNFWVWQISPCLTDDVIS